MIQDVASEIVDGAVNEIVETLRTALKPVLARAIKQGFAQALGITVPALFVETGRVEGKEEPAEDKPRRVRKAKAAPNAVPGMTPVSPSSAIGYNLDAVMGVLLNDPLGLRSEAIQRLLGVPAAGKRGLAVLLAKAVKDGKIVRSGEKRATTYALPTSASSESLNGAAHAEA